SMLFGFSIFIWSLAVPSGAMMMWGLFSIATGAYLGFAPAVHFFAQRQKEQRSWTHSLAVATVFALLIVSLATGTFGLFYYRQRAQQDALAFADTAFERIF